MPFPNTTSGDDEKNPVATLCQQLFRKEVVQSPPVFVKGEDVTCHLHKVGEYCHLANLIADEDQVADLMNTLDINLQKELKMTHGFNHEKFQVVVDIFRKTCEQKKATISPLVKLFEVKQAQHQHVDEYIREIRIWAHDVIYEYPVDEREQLMVTCLIKGLRNEAISSALGILAPKTLDEAWKLIKKEDNKKTFSNSIDVVHCTSSCQARINALEKHVQKLEEMVTKLSSANMRTWPSGTFADAVRGRIPLRNNFSNNQFRNSRGNNLETSRNNNNFRDNRRCYNCQNVGHLSTSCPHPQRCFRCSKVGHISRFCKVSFNKRQAVNFVEETHNTSENPGTGAVFRKPVSSAGSSVSEPQELCVSNKFHSLEDEGDTFGNGALEADEDIYMLSKMNRPTSKKRPMTRHMEGTETEALISAQLAFIEGKGTNPNKSHPTTRCDEVSLTNKPIVKTRLNGRQVLSLMDSGASCNLIDLKLINKLKAKCILQIKPTDCSIACANSSVMNHHGEVVLTFSLTGTTVPMKFIIVDGLHSVDCIIGLRAMKKLGVKFNFKGDNIVLNEIIIPFESVIYPSTSIPDLGNV